MFIMKPREEHIYLKKRKGIVRIAVETGTSIIPVFHFGNTEVSKCITKSNDADDFGHMTLLVDGLACSCRSLVLGPAGSSISLAACGYQ